MTEPLKIELTLDLDSYLATHSGYDRDGEPMSAPTTIEELVFDQAARLIAFSPDRDNKAMVRERLDAISAEEIRARVVPHIEVAIAESVQPTDTWGKPKGDPVTLREVIVTEARKLLTAKTRDRDDYRGPERTLVDRLIATEVAKAVHKELTGAIAEAKEQVTAAVKAEGAKVIAETIVRMTGVR